MLVVIPAKAGIHTKNMDSRLHGNDNNKLIPDALDSRNKCNTLNKKKAAPGKAPLFGGVRERGIRGCDKRI